MAGMDQRGNCDLIGFFIFSQGNQSTFGKGGSAVIVGGCGNIHSQEFCYHGLKFIDPLEGSLADFRLVGGVGCGKFRP